MLHFIPHFFGNIEAGRRKNIQWIDAKLNRLKAPGTPQGEIIRIQALITAKADLDVVDAQGHTELTQAISKGNTEAARLLLENGASFDKQSKIDPDNPQSPFVIALEKKNFEIAKLLKEKGKIDINALEPTSKRSYLQEAIHSSNEEAVG